MRNIQEIFENNTKQNIQSVLKVKNYDHFYFPKIIVGKYGTFTRQYLIH